jgi:hypothetical protein
MELARKSDKVFLQVGHSAGAGSLNALQQKVRMALYCALAAGALAFAALASLQIPVSAFFALTSEVHANPWHPFVLHLLHVLASDICGDPA